MRLVTTLLVLLSLVGGAAFADDAIGSAFGTLTTARVIGQDRGSLGFGIGLADNATSFLGNFTYGMSRYMDGRIKLALVDPDGGGDTEIGIGGDIKWQYWNYDSTTTYPFDMAFGGFFEYFDFGYTSANLKVGLTAGAKWQMTPTFAFLGELQLDGNDGLFLGIDWGIM